LFGVPERKGLTVPAGFTRFRKHQLAKQTVIGTAVAATRAVPWRGAIVIDPQRTAPDIDVGNIDEVVSPLSGAKAITGSWTGPVDYDNLAIVYSAGLKGGVSPTGATAKSWVFQAGSTAPDPFDYYTDEWGDDTSDSPSLDGIKASGGVLESFTIAYGEDQAPFALDGAMVYADATIGARTAGLTVNASPIWMYGADTEVFLDTTSGAIGTTKLVDAVRGASVAVTNNLDQKRYSNGSNTRFKLSAYGRGARLIEVQFTVEKTAATIAERATIDDDPVPDRFLELRTTSPSIITGVIPYSNSIRCPARLITATDGEIGGNATITFTYHAFYSSALSYAIRAVVVNTLAATP
jgi:hypothetical protein